MAIAMYVILGCVVVSLCVAAGLRSEKKDSMYQIGLLIIVYFLLPPFTLFFIFIQFYWIIGCCLTQRQRHWTVNSMREWYHYNKERRHTSLVSWDSCWWDKTKLKKRARPSKKAEDSGSNENATGPEKSERSQCQCQCRCQCR